MAEHEGRLVGSKIMLSCRSKNHHIRETKIKSVKFDRMVFNDDPQFPMGGLNEQGGWDER